MGKKIAILQSNYIPWKGYFDIINSVDEFIIYDDVQYTKNDWRNRNKIKTENGLQWIAIPVRHTSSLKIKDVKVVNNHWRKKHWNSLVVNYSKAKYFKEYKEQFEHIYLSNTSLYLSEINFDFFELINRILGIKTKIKWSMDFNLHGDKMERLINLCKQTDATEYLSGPAAKDYIDEKLFMDNEIKLTWMNYNNYPVYNQLWPPLEHGVSIVDLLFNEGPNSKTFMKSFK